MALTMRQYNNCINLSVDDERVVRYLKGETIDVDDFMTARAGHCFESFDGYPLGFG